MIGPSIFIDLSIDLPTTGEDLLMFSVLWGGGG